MRKSDVVAFFNERAADWDKELIKSDWIINTILDYAGICENGSVLDVACGTGVLIPYYLERQVESVTAVDISPEMIKQAQNKFSQKNVLFLCDDAEKMNFDRAFDSIVIYNAFPHFPNPEKLIGHLSAFLKQGGKLTVAHGMSRAQIDRCHCGQAAHISNGLMHEDELSALFSMYLTVTHKISDDDMYLVTGVKN